MVYCMTACVQMVVKQPDLVIREGAVEESRLAAVRLRELLPTVDIDRWVGIKCSKVANHDLKQAFLVHKCVE